MYEDSRELTTVTLITIWWLPKLGNDCKQAALKFDGERFNLRKLNELEGRKQYRIKISNRFAVLEILNDNEDIHWV
jgi:hypothetical protein